VPAAGRIEADPPRAGARRGAGAGGYYPV